MRLPYCVGGTAPPGHVWILCGLTRHLSWQKGGKMSEVALLPGYEGRVRFVGYVIEQQRCSDTLTGGRMLSATYSIIIMIAEVFTHTLNVLTRVVRPKDHI